MVGFVLILRSNEDFVVGWGDVVGCTEHGSTFIRKHKSKVTKMQKTMFLMLECCLVQL